LWWDASELRAATPVARFGNLLIFRGQFNMSGKQAVDRYVEARDKIFANLPDYKAAEALLQQSVTADPRAFFVHITLGNVRLRLGSREGALAAYQAALQHAPDAEMQAAIRKQIQRVTTESTESLDQIPFLRDPAME
jgi:regulator of sirC expression with transglutaminase-like and TPR domain